jgi:hypothetical protein
MITPAGAREMNFTIQRDYYVRTDHPPLIRALPWVSDIIQAGGVLAYYLEPYPFKLPEDSGKLIFASAMQRGARRFKITTDVPAKSNLKFSTLPWIFAAPSKSSRSMPCGRR